MRNIWRIIILTIAELSGSALTYYLWRLQETKPSNPSSNDIESELSTACVAFMIVVLVNVLVVANEFRYKNRVCRDWLKSLMEVIYTEVGGKTYKPRISIYRPMLGCFAFFWYVFWIGPHVINRNGFSNIGLFWKNAPWHWGRTYLYLWDRKVTENEGCSQTIIRTTYVREKENGVLDTFHRCKSSGDVQVPSISNIRIPEEYPVQGGYAKKISNTTLSKEEIALLLQHLKGTYINESNYCLFKAMQKHSTDFHVTVLNDSNQKFWGLLVIESEMDKKSTFAEKLGDKVERYSQLFSSLHQVL